MKSLIENKQVLSVMVTLGLVVGIMISNLVIPAQAADVSKPNKQLTAKWWEWVLAIPPNVNPLADETGENCNVDQKGPVWYLAGTTGGSAERDCTIPQGKAILFPIINVFCSEVTDNIVTTIDSPSQLKPGLVSCAQSFMDIVDTLKVTIDNKDLTDLQNTRVLSPVFKISYPNPNVYNVDTTEEPQKSVSDGFWVLLKGLTPGEHDITFTGGISELGFETTVTYHLTIVPK